MFRIPKRFIHQVGDVLGCPNLKEMEKTKAKTVECLIELKKIGWFKPDIIDSIIREVREVEGK